MAQFPMAQSTVSRHIKELMSAGLVDVSGRKGDYVLNHKNLTEGLRALGRLLDYSGTESNTERS